MRHAGFSNKLCHLRNQHDSTAIHRESKLLENKVSVVKTTKESPKHSPRLFSHNKFARLFVLHMPMKLPMRSCFCESLKTSKVVFSTQNICNLARNPGCWKKTLRIKFRIFSEIKIKKQMPAHPAGLVYGKAASETV